MILVKKGPWGALNLGTRFRGQVEMEGALWTASHEARFNHYIFNERSQLSNTPDAVSLVPISK